MGWHTNERNGDVNVEVSRDCWHTVEVSRDSRHENGFEFPARGSYLLVRFCHACDVLLLVSCLIRM